MSEPLAVGADLGAQYSVDEKREAFAAWDRYKAQLAQSIRDMVPNVPVRGQNPLFPIIFADGYLRGKRAQAARLAAVERLVGLWTQGAEGGLETLEALEALLDGTEAAPFQAGAVGTGEAGDGA